MGYEADGVALYGQYAPDEAVYGTWIDDKTIDACLLEPVRAIGWLANATHLQINTDDPQPLPSPDALAALAARWRSEAISIFAGDADAPDWQLHLAPGRSGLRLTVGIGVRFLTANTRRQASDLVQRWCEGLAQRRCRLAFATLTPHGAYERPRPPREGEFWPLGALDYSFGRSWHTAGRRPDGSQVLAALERTELPAGAARRSDGDRLEIAFAAELADLTDEAAIATARADAERWLAPLIPTTVERGWNELGDRVVVPPYAPDRAELPPFTYYDTAEQIAYKALIMDPDSHEIDEDMWAQLVAIQRAGRTADGKVIQAVRLIFPARENALAIHDRAIADGFDKVLYPVGTAFWEVHPT